MGSHHRHLADDTFTGKDIPKYYQAPEPLISMRTIGAVAVVIVVAVVIFGIGH